MVMLPITLGDP